MNTNQLVNLLTWIENVNFYEENILNTSNDSDYGCILEVDLIYPQHLFKTHKDLPLCPLYMIPRFFLTLNLDLKLVQINILNYIKFKQN